MTGGAQEQGQGLIGGSVLSRTIAGKVVGERPSYWAGDPGLREGGWWGPGSGQWLQALPLWHNLPQLSSGAGRITPSQAQAKDVSSAGHLGPSISSGQGRRPQKKEIDGEGQREGAGPMRWHPSQAPSS